MKKDIKMQTQTLTPQQIAGHKAAHTRLVQRFDRYVQIGNMTTQEAAGFKANSKRRLNRILRENKV